MGFRHLFFPETIKIPDSSINKNIFLQRYFIGDTLIVDGLIESGNIMRHIWKVGIEYLIPHKFRPKSVLLLGLAGGSNAHLVRELYPDAHITAVEVDPLMTEIGYTYFKLSSINNFEIITADALNFAKELNKNDHYDLILVDCFVGQEIPKKLENLDFFNYLKSHSEYVLINRLWHGKYYPISLDFLKSLSSKFKCVTTFTGTNLVISLL